MGPLDRYLDLRDSLHTSRRGRGGGEVCAVLTSRLDHAISELVSPVPDGVAVVAVGGYGRAELSPHSDIDLMLLHPGDDPAELAAALFRPLWDAKLRVGHAVRTLSEAASAARERFETQTTLLTSRLVIGDEELFVGLMEDVSAVTRARPLRRYLVSEERRRRDASPHLLMATDVKSGRGGLRTLHGFEWERRREALIGRFSSDSTGVEDHARETLLSIRNALHAVTGRSHDVYSPDLREQVARWLEVDLDEAAGELVDAVRTVDRLAESRWPGVMDPRRGNAWRRLTGRPRSLVTTRPPALDELWRLLETGEEGQAAFERLWDRGFLQSIIPEWGMVRTLPELAPFHEHPVASHLWRAVGEMRLLIADDGHYGRVAAEVDDVVVLLFAAFLHDIGKGQGGDHAEIGARIARSFCLRLGIEGDRLAVIEQGVRLHLLLVTTATRRDLDDPGVIEEVAGQVGGLRLLQVLYLLTVADSKATGVTMWSDWKATLVRTLFLRCAARFGADRVQVGGTSRDEVLASVAPGRGGEVAAHLDALPEGYLRSVSAADVLWHVDLLSELDGASLVGVRPGDLAETAVVVGAARPYFRCRVAEAFAANGIDVLEGRLFTRRDGVIVDTFRVRDDRTGGPVDPGRWESLRRDLEAGLRGDLDTGAKMATRAAAYSDRVGEVPVVRLSVDAATEDLVVTIECADRIGLLAEILNVLDGCGLDIRLAKIDGRLGEVVDTFHVDADGLDQGAIRELEGRVASGLRP